MKKKGFFNDVDSIEFTLFDSRGGSIVKWRKAPKNITPAKIFLKKKGINL
jgi:hypothetical protein